MGFIMPSQKLEIRFSTGLKMNLEIPEFYRPLSEELVTSLVSDLALTTGSYLKKPILISLNRPWVITPGWLSCTARLLVRTGSLWTATMRLSWKFRTQNREYARPSISSQRLSIVN